MPAPWPDPHARRARGHSDPPAPATLPAAQNSMAIRFAVRRSLRPRLQDAAGRPSFHMPRRSTAATVSCGADCT
eukprot:5575056-Prymnesium_polylepis.1